MDLFQNLATAAPQLFTVSTMLLMMVGTLAGLLAGAIPGFTIAMAVVLVLPFTFTMSAVQGLATMIAVYVGGLSRKRLRGAGAAASPRCDLTSSTRNKSASGARMIRGHRADDICPNIGGGSWKVATNITPERTRKNRATKKSRLRDMAKSGPGYRGLRCRI